MNGYKYNVIRSKRRTVSIQITGASFVTVRAPLKMKDDEIKRILEKKQGWIDKHIRGYEKTVKAPAFTEKELSSLISEARKDISGRAMIYAGRAGVTYGRISIKHQKTRWGSCSSKGNLNFNCLLMLCPPDVRDYVVIHELCHRKELNHSKSFWALVGKIMPDYKEKRLWLKKEGGKFIARLP